MKHFTWIAALALVGCGGAEFTQAPDEAALLAARAPDGAREAPSGFPGGEDDAGEPRPDTGGGPLEASAVEAAVNEAGAGDVRAIETEGGALEAGRDAAESGGTCTPIPSKVSVCSARVNRTDPYPEAGTPSFTLPGSICVSHGASFTVWTVESTPSACLCAETSTCACIFANLLCPKAAETPGCTTNQLGDLFAWCAE
jgi:hypothetical protein